MFIEIRDSSRITDAERWFMGNGFLYEKDTDNPLLYRISSNIPGYVENLTDYFRANYVPYVLYDDAMGIVDTATDYPRAYLNTPAAAIVRGRLL